MGLTQNVPSTNICFYKYAHNSGPKGSPDMILTAFDVKFHEKKNELPPEAWNPQTKIPKIQKNQSKMGPPEPPPARAKSPGGGSPPREKALCVA